MIKRITSIAFILLANILLLAHAVVPHHHHHKQVCLVNSHCIDINLADDLNTNRDNHNHDGEKNSDDCILKEPVIVLTNQWKVDLRFNDKTPDQTSLDEFYNCPSHIITGFIFPVFSRVLTSHFNNSRYSSLVSTSLGLRAPPVV
jgi:hypothetical protein